MIGWEKSKREGVLRRGRRREHISYRGGFIMLVVEVEDILLDESYSYERVEKQYASRSPSPRPHSPRSQGTAWGPA
jgi:hypothetical protein